MPDARFVALANDPRYRIPNRKKSRTAVDSRFKSLFSDQDFRKKASVDRYGRKINPSSGKKDLDARFQLQEDDEEDTISRKSGKHARDVVGSSDSEENEEEEEDGSLVKGGVRRDPAREGGFSESSSEEEDSEAEVESDAEAELAEETAGGEQAEDIPMGEVSRRLAAVNLDWDNIRAADILAVASSFAPKNARVENVTIYPSEFGRERLEREEVEGPPREIFALARRTDEAEDEGEGEDEEDSAAEASDEDHDSDSDNERIKQQLLKEQSGDADNIDTAKLRQYQLERLRYYYAVISCDTNTTAKALYDAMDGREYLSSANFFDLRFIPDETSFEDDKPHEQCNELPIGYRPNDFKTEALTHSKVRLTWDDDDATRKEVQKRAFSRAEMDEEDLRAYIGSDSSDAESISSRKSTAEDRKAAKKAAQREKMRAALGLTSEPVKISKQSKDEPIGDMQITFTSGLSASKEGKGVFENEPQDEESTRARYIRKEKERKQRRKEKAKLKSGDQSSDEEKAARAENDDDDVQDNGFDDPFFNDPSAASEKAAKQAKKADKRAKRSALEAKQAEADARKADLALLMTGDGGEGTNDELRHFDMREIKKAEKEAKRKGKNKKNKKSREDDVNEQRDDFEIETQDPRFKKLFESHEFAIDPTDRLYQKTKGMEAALESGRKKRKMDLGDGEDVDADTREAKRQGNKARRARI